MQKLKESTINITKKILNERANKEPEQINEFQFIKKAFGKGKLPPFYKWSEEEALEPLVRIQRLPAQNFGARKMQAEDLLGDEVPFFLNKDPSRVGRIDDKRFLKAFKERMEQVRSLIEKIEKVKNDDPKMPAVKFVKAHMASIKQKMQRRLKIYEDLYEKYTTGPKRQRSTTSSDRQEPDDSNKPMSKFERERFIKDLDARGKARREKERRFAAADARERERERAMGTGSRSGSYRV